MRILVVADQIPFPPIGGGAQRIFHLLKLLAREHSVTLIGFSYGARGFSAQIPVRIIDVPWHGASARVSGSLRSISDSFADSLPLFARWAASQVLLETVGRTAEEGFDLAFIENSYMATVLEVMPVSLPKVLDLHDVHTFRLLREAERQENSDQQVTAKFEAEAAQFFERTAVERCVRCLAVSELEAAAARDLLGAHRVAVVPNGVDTREFRPSVGAKSQQILFTGVLDYEPNIEGAQFLATRVLPEVARTIPGVKLHLVGARPTRDIAALASPQVVIHADPVDVRPHLREATIVVVPLFTGGGTRIKTLEGAAAGKAIVSTSFGAEGLRFINDRDIVIADTPTAFAARVVELLASPDRRERLQRAARKVALSYDWRRLGPCIRAVVGEAVA